MPVYEYWKSTLSPVGQRCYEQFCRANLQVSQGVPMPTSNADEIFAAYGMYVKDHPESYCVSHQMQISTNSSFFGLMKSEATAMLTPYYSAAEQMHYDRALEQRLREFDALIAGVADELERERLAVRFVTEGAAYEIRSFYTCSAVGALVDRRAQCEGFAKAFKLLCDRAGLRCIYVEGELQQGGSSGPHAWNMVWIQGVPYHVDVTAMLTTGGVESGSYLNLSDDQISKSHRWDRSLVPACRTTLQPTPTSESNSLQSFQNLFGLRMMISKALQDRETQIKFYLTLSNTPTERLMELVQKTLTEEIKKARLSRGFSLKMVPDLRGGAFEVTFLS